MRDGVESRLPPLSRPSTPPHHHHSRAAARGRGQAREQVELRTLAAACAEPAAPRVGGGGGGGGRLVILGGGGHGLGRGEGVRGRGIGVAASVGRARSPERPRSSASQARVGGPPWHARLRAHDTWRRIWPRSLSSLAVVAASAAVERAEVAFGAVRGLRGGCPSARARALAGAGLGWGKGRLRRVSEKMFEDAASEGVARGTAPFCAPSPIAPSLGAATMNRFVVPLLAAAALIAVEAPGGGAPRTASRVGQTALPPHRRETAAVGVHVRWWRSARPSFGGGSGRAASDAWKRAGNNASTAANTTNTAWKTTTNAARRPRRATRARAPRSWPTTPEPPPPSSGSSKKNPLCVGGSGLGLGSGRLELGCP